MQIKHIAENHVTFHEKYSLSTNNIFTSRNRTFSIPIDLQYICLQLRKQMLISWVTHACCTYRIS